ncbi:hypothetical protein NE167_11830 [Clostridium botulinum]|uniref:hypothetical protein n=1 Tax=Clostridium botulinum TaxID=1491 RepID=UPI00214781C9|nr:hypothetical protein [Clostridium botulinum]MCR1177770.1 hypothetical protein [Clostridium botulinum]
MKKTKTYFSLNSFSFDGMFIPSHSSKIATIWFDEIIVQPNPEENILVEFAEIDFRKYVKESIEEFGEIANLNNDTICELSKSIVPLNNYLKTWKTYLDTSDEVGDYKLFYYADKVIREKLYEYDEIYTTPGILSGINAWTELRKLDDVFFIPNLAEKLVLDNMFERSFQDNGYELFSKIIDFKIPDFNEISWDKVIELRKHPFLESFRTKISLLNESFNKNDTKVTNEIIEEVARKDMAEFVKLSKPAPIKSTIKGIASNMPLPVPNPYAIYLSAVDVKRQIDFSKKYGWLYFYLDL